MRPAAEPTLHPTAVPPPAPPSAARLRAGLARLDRALTPATPWILGGLLVAAALQSWWAKARGGADFFVFHEAARRLWRGEALYRLSDGAYPFKYAPAIAALFVPFAALPRALAALAWDLVSALALLRVMLWSARRLSARASLAMHLAVAVLVAPFAIHLFALAQSDAVLLWLAVESEDRATSQPWLSGALWSAACLAKPPFLALLPLAILRRQGRRLASLSLCIALGAALPALRYGVDGTIDLLRAWRAILDATTPPLVCGMQNQSAFAIACSYLARPGSAAFAIAVAALAAAAAAIIAVAVLSIGHRDRALGSFIATAGALYLTACLSPLGWRTNLIAAVPLLYLLVDAARGRTARGARWLATGTVLAVFLVQRLDYEVVGSSRFAWLLEHRHFGISTLAAAMAAAVATAWATRAAPPPEAISAGTPCAHRPSSR